MILSFELRAFFEFEHADRNFRITEDGVLEIPSFGNWEGIFDEYSDHEYVKILHIGHEKLKSATGFDGSINDIIKKQREIDE